MKFKFNLSSGFFLLQDGSKDEGNVLSDDNVEVNDHPQASATAASSSSSGNGTKRRKRDEAVVDDTQGKTEGGDDPNNDSSMEDEEEGGGDGSMNEESAQGEGTSAVPEQVRDQHIVFYFQYKIHT